MKSRGTPSLSVKINPSLSDDRSLEGSFEAGGTVFCRDGMRIDAEGMQLPLKTFEKGQAKLVYENLRIGRVVGQGSSSVVLEAVYTCTHRGSLMVALKVINVFQRTKRNQLIREIQSLYSCDCPAIIGFYGAFYREGAISIALEFMNGGSLANVMSQVGSLPEEVLAHISFQILYGLTYLKRQKRVHRDIKPSNLLINSSGEVKVTDFGVSASLGNSIAMCGTFVGTFKYMSPERICAAPYSYASDIWSTGLVLLEGAIGVYPYPEENTCIGMAQTILEAEIPAPPRGASVEFVQFLAHCLHKDPLKRLPAEILLTAPWLQKHNAVSIRSSVTALQIWIQGLRQITTPW